VRETWQQNEKENASVRGPSTTDKDLERAIQKEASEYDDANKEERLLTGDRASVKDDDALQE
jgi:hypothetical protein